MLLKEQIVGDEVLFTNVAEVTNILNSRPLTRNSSDAKEFDPLTLNHLLHLRSSMSFPPGVFENDGQHTQRQWRQAQFLANLFWKRWMKEYLPQLQRRQKWNEVERNLEVDDTVLLTDQNFSRGQWPLARVVEVKKGKDGCVRSAQIRTSFTVVTRAKRKR